MTPTATAAPNGQATAPPVEMNMDFVQPGAAPTTQNFLLYGPPGSGKSTGGASAPGPILWGNAEGENALRYAREHFPDKVINEFPITGDASLRQLFLYMKSGGQGEQTFVLDTVGEVYRILLEEISGGSNPTLQNYGDINTKLERFCRSLRDLPINVVLLAHEEIADVEGQPTRRPVTGGKKLPEQLMAQVDHVGYTAVIPGNPEEKTETRYVAQLVEAAGRRAKNRGGKLGAFRDLDLTEWIQVVTGTTPQKEGK